MRFAEFIGNCLRRRKDFREGASLKDAIPPEKRKALLRLLLIAVATWCVCKWLCIPVWINGASMEPRYASSSFNFCWTPAFWLSPPKQGDVVVVKYAGRKIMLLKRVVAVAGQTVEFKKGRLHVDGAPLFEPYVKGPCKWELPKRLVDEGKLYVVGDNRSMPQDEHLFGSIDLKKVEGAPLW